VPLHDLPSGTTIAKCEAMTSFKSSKEASLWKPIVRVDAGDSPKRLNFRDSMLVVDALNSEPRVFKLRQPVADRHICGNGPPSSVMNHQESGRLKKNTEASRAHRDKVSSICATRALLIGCMMRCKMPRYTFSPTRRCCAQNIVELPVRLCGNQPVVGAPSIGIQAPLESFVDFLSCVSAAPGIQQPYKGYEWI
jgi:hypothetical protein